MNKKILAASMLSVVVAFVWLNWVLVPNFGGIILRITLPFYIPFIVFASELGYLISKQASQKRVTYAEDLARHARHEVCDIMHRSSEITYFYERRDREREELYRKTLEAQRRMAEVRKVMAQERVELDALREQQQNHEELKRQLQSTEKENASLKGRIKRYKTKIAELQKTSEDLEETD